MRIRRSGWMALAAAAVSAAALFNSGLGEDATTVPRSAAQPAADLAVLLNQVQVVDHIPSVDGYERSCRKGDGPLTELTAQVSTNVRGAERRRRNDDYPARIRSKSMLDMR